MERRISVTLHARTKHVFVHARARVIIIINMYRRTLLQSTQMNSELHQTDGYVWVVTQAVMRAPHFESQCT